MKNEIDRLLNKQADCCDEIRPESQKKGHYYWGVHILVFKKLGQALKKSLKTRDQKIYSEIVNLESTLQTLDNGDYCNRDSVNRDKIKARIATIKGLLIGCACLFFMVLLSLGNHEPRRTSGSGRVCSRTIRREVMA